MAFFSALTRSSITTPSPTSGLFSTLHSSRAELTSLRLMEKLSCSLTASMRLWASSTMRTMSLGSTSSTERKFSLMSGSMIWMYGATMTSKSFIIAFLTS